MRWQAGLATVLLLSVVLSGCFGKDKPPEPEPVVPPAPEQPDPEDVTPQIPPCALRPGSIQWPAWEGAPPPDGPVEVTIKRDAYGVPHIYADDPYALWYANGYVQAQDRLFELDLLRHVGWGDSAGVVGAAQLSSDFQVHRDLYSHEEIRAQYEAVPTEAKQILQAYADGVNRYIAEATARNELPGEFAALGHDPHPWTPEDSVASIIYLIGYFGVDGGHELGNLQRLATMNQTIGDRDAEWDAFGDMVWLRIDDHYTTIPFQDKLVNGCEDPLPRDEVDHQLVNMEASLDAVVFGGDPVGSPGLRPPLFSDEHEEKGKGLFAGFKWGSNAFLLDAKLSETGKPIMWGAPQMGYYKPPVPYQIGLHGAGFDAVGIGVASAPGIVIGRNADIAWSATSGIEDMTDVVELTLDGPRSYLWDGEVRQMDCHTVVHQTAPAPADFAAFPNVAPPQTYDQEVCRADGMAVVAINEAAGVAWAKRWTTRGEELVGAFIWLGLAKAGSAAEFHDMVADFPFTFNFHVADHEDVYYIHTGNIPLRADGYDYRLPTPSGSAYEWEGTAYTGEMGTWHKNPSTGYFANWNNGPAFGWRAGDQRGLWGPVHRVQAEDRVIRASLATNGMLDHGDIEAANWAASTTDSLAAPFMPHLIAAADAVGETGIAESLRDWQAAGLPWRDDNGDGLYDDPGHAVWDRAMAKLLDMQDELGDHNHALNLDPRTAGDAHAGDHGEHRNPFATMLKALQGNAAYNWCSEAGSPAIDCPEALQMAMVEIGADLRQTYGDEPSTWLEPLHYSGFTPMGAFNGDERPMVNRGSWVQVVAMGEGLDGATSALPPSNIGRINSQETAQWVAAGSEPGRLTLELDMYWSGQYKPFPLTESEVDLVAIESGNLIVLPP